jgi:hypothetical protein
LTKALAAQFQQLLVYTQQDLKLFFLLCFEMVLIISLALVISAVAPIFLLAHVNILVDILLLGLHLQAFLLQTMQGYLRCMGSVHFSQTLYFYLMRSVSFCL